MSLLDMPLVEGGTGEVVSVEALREGSDHYASRKIIVAAEHAYDGSGNLIHTTPMFAEAVALLEIDREGPLTHPHPVSRCIWAEGFTRAPTTPEKGRVEWEIERKGPQLIQVGLHHLQPTWMFDFYKDLEMETGFGNGKGWIRFWTFNRPGEDQKGHEAIMELSGILIVVRSFA